MFMRKTYSIQTQCHIISFPSYLSIEQLRIRRAASFMAASSGTKKAATISITWCNKSKFLPTPSHIWSSSFLLNKFLWFLTTFTPKPRRAFMASPKSRLLSFKRNWEAAFSSTAPLDTCYKFICTSPAWLKWINNHLTNISITCPSNIMQPFVLGNFAMFL